MVKINTELKNAFTIIELMVVVGIISFLATLSMTQSSKYFAKAKRAEVAMNLASLHTAEQAYYAEHGEYTDKLTGPNSLNWTPQNNNFNYTYGFNTAGAKEGINYFVGKLKTPNKELHGTSVSKDKFVAAAVGTVIEDKIDLWTIDQDRNLENIKDGLS